MPAENKNKKPLDAWMGIYLSIGKLTDSGLGPFIVIGVVVVALAFALTWGLDSKDRLEFLKYVVEIRAFAWGGWVVAGVAIWVARWMLTKERAWAARELARVDKVKDEALQTKLDLPESKPKTTP